LVVSGEADASRLLQLFKGVSSRRLGQRFGRRQGGHWWTRHGSRRLLRDERAFEQAIRYVMDQASPLVVFEHDPNTAGVPRDKPEPRDSSRADDSRRTEDRSDAEEPRDMNVAARARPASWPDADFIIGNPPFLGSKLFRQQGLDDDYIEALFAAYELPNTSDLCCYWFERARQEIERNPAARAGLLATQGIRGGANRTVLERIKETGDIFMAWSDREWVLDGAAVHVSIVGFDDGRQGKRILDGYAAESVNPDLTVGLDATCARQLSENRAVPWSIGTQKGGSFDVDWTTARGLLATPGPTAMSNCEVVFPWVSGVDVTKRNRGKWIVYFDPTVSESDASRFDARSSTFGHM